MSETLHSTGNGNVLRIVGVDSGSRQGRIVTGNYDPNKQELQFNQTEWFDVIPITLKGGINVVPIEVWNQFASQVVEKTYEAQLVPIVGAAKSTLDVLNKGQLIGPCPLNGDGKRVYQTIADACGELPRPEQDQEAAIKLAAVIANVIPGIETDDRDWYATRIGAITAAVLGILPGIPPCDIEGLTLRKNLTTRQQHETLANFGLKPETNYRLWPSTFDYNGRECVMEGDNSADLQFLSLLSKRSLISSKFIAVEGGTWLKAAMNFWGPLDRYGLTSWKSPIGALINDWNIRLQQPFMSLEGKHQVHGKYEHISDTIYDVITKRRQELLNSDLVYIPEPPMGFWCLVSKSGKVKPLEFEDLPVDRQSVDLITAVNNICVYYQLRRFMEQNGVDLEGVEAIGYSGNLRPEQEGCHLALVGSLPRQVRSGMILGLEESVKSLIVTHLEKVKRLPIRNLKQFVNIDTVNLETGAFDPLYETFIRGVEGLNRQYPGRLTRLR